MTNYGSSFLQNAIAHSWIIFSYCPIPIGSAETTFLKAYSGQSLDLKSISNEADKSITSNLRMCPRRSSRGLVAKQAVHTQPDLRMNGWFKTTCSGH